MTVTGTVLRQIPESFLGLSLNVEEMQRFVGAPAFAPIINNVLDAQDSWNGPFVLRLGGTYVDSSYWDREESTVASIYRAPSSFAFQRGQRWMNSLAAVVRETGSDVILNVNAVAHDPQMALDFVSDAEQTLPAGSISAVAIGNEPDDYANPTVRVPAGARTMTEPDYTAVFSSYAQALHKSFPTLPLAGPELAYPVDWQWASALFDQDPGEVGLLTAHVYPLSACAAPGSVAYPSVDAYLQAALVQQTTASLQPLLALAAAAGVPFRVTELGSGTCNGVRGVSNTFAPALWSINQLFSLLDAGVDGVTVHLRADQPNSAVVLDPHSPGGLAARPLLYGLAAFADTLQNGETLNGTRGQLQPGVSVWPVHGPNGWRVALVNTSPSEQLINLRMPAAGGLSVTQLQAQSPASTRATFGERTITTAGTWSGPLYQLTVRRAHGVYPVVLPPTSAAVAQLVASAPDSGIADPRHRRSSAATARRSRRKDRRSGHTPKRKHTPTRGDRDRRTLAPTRTHAARGGQELLDHGAPGRSPGGSHLSMRLVPAGAPVITAVLAGRHRGADRLRTRVGAGRGGLRAPAFDSGRQGTTWERHDRRGSR